MTRCAWILLVLGLTACDDPNNYCAGLIALAESHEVQADLRRWVAENVIGRTYTYDDPDVYGAGGMYPGFYWLKTDFDWSSLGFDEQWAQVRLVGKLDDVKSVFFGERSRYGVLVRNGTSGTFGVPEQHLRVIADDIAVLCGPED